MTEQIQPINLTDYENLCLIALKLKLGGDKPSAPETAKTMDELRKWSTILKNTFGEADANRMVEKLINYGKIYNYDNGKNDDAPLPPDNDILNYAFAEKTMQKDPLWAPPQPNSGGRKTKTHRCKGIKRNMTHRRRLGRKRPTKKNRRN